MSEFLRRVPGADRTLDLLEALGAAPDGLTTADLLEVVEGSRSGLYDLLATLRERRYVVTEDGRHRLGPGVWALVRDRPAEVDTLLDSFPDETAGFPETIALVWPEDGHAVVLAEHQPDRPVRAVYPAGSRRGEGSPDVMLLRAGESSTGEETLRIHRAGSARQASPELTELAVPICRDGVHPTAALVAGIPAGRPDPSPETELLDRLRTMAARLSHRLGAITYQPYGWATTDAVGPTRDLKPAEIDEFLTGIWGAQLACVRTDGTPHVVPLWYEWDGAGMWLAASPGSSWRAAVAENPRVSVTLDEPWPPLRRAFLSGVAREVPPEGVPGGLEGLRRRLAVRYLGKGADREPELAETEGWAAIRIEPERIHGRQGLGVAAGGNR